MSSEHPGLSLHSSRAHHLPEGPALRSHFSSILAAYLVVEHSHFNSRWLLTGRSDARSQTKSVKRVVSDVSLFNIRPKSSR